MVRVKVIKLNEEYLDIATEEEKQRVGNIYEAFHIVDDYQQIERYQKQYAINLGTCIWFVPEECCEVIPEIEPTLSENPQTQKPSQYKRKFLLVEDGSVDIDQIEEEFGIDCIVYRQGAKKPEWLEY